MTTPIQRLADEAHEIASDEQHAALYELLVDAASEVPAGELVGDIEREEAA